MAERCIYSHNFSHSCSWQLWKTHTQGRGCRKTARWSSKLAQSFWCQNIFDLSQQVFSRFPSQFELAYLVNSQVADWKCLVVHFYASQEAGLKVAEYLHTAKMLQGMSLVTGGVGTRSRGTLAAQNLVTLQTSHLVSFLCSVFVLHVWSWWGLLYRSVSATNSEKIDIDILHL